MTAYLMDTNVLSELRKGSRCDPRVAAWQSGISLNDQYVSSITLMELRAGALAVRRSDAHFAKLLENWFENLIKPAFEGRILAVDLAVAERGSVLKVKRTREMADLLIAATAYVHGLTLVTRSTADFNDTGIRLVNPWQADVAG